MPVVTKVLISGHQVSMVAARVSSSGMRESIHQAKKGSVTAGVVTHHQRTAGRGKESSPRISDQNHRLITGATTSVAASVKTGSNLATSGWSNSLLLMPSA